MATDDPPIENKITLFISENDNSLNSENIFTDL